MTFTFGKYNGVDIDFVLEIDRKYCEWIVQNIEKRYPDIYPVLIEKLSKLDPECENPQIMMFGKYEGEEIEKFIFSDKSYCKWLLEKESFKIEYPKTFEFLSKYFDIIYNEQVTETVFFYVLKFIDKEYLKVGITGDFIVKRIYSYSHTINYYDQDIIDYKNSFVFKSNDIEIEKKVLKHFKGQRIDRKTERVVTTISDIEKYIKECEKLNSDFYYRKKCLKDFIPFEYSFDFKESFYIKINQFQDFKNVYESNLKNINLFKNYNSDFTKYERIKTKHNNGYK